MKASVLERNVALVNWLYPVNEGSDYRLVDASGRSSAVTPENLWADIDSNPDQVDRWYLSTGFRTMRPDDLVWIYAAGSYQFICALGRVVRVEQNRATWHMFLIWDIKATAALRKNPIARSQFQQVPQAPQRANNVTADYLNRWSSHHQIRHSTSSESPISTEDARHRIIAAIVQRRGQAKFRTQLLSDYGGRCCATGERAQDVLEAAHIAPYLGPASNRPSNGLLLRADIHTLFDLHLIAVDNQGRWAVSSKLDRTSYAALRGKKPRAPKAHPPDRGQLARHYSLFRP